MILKKIFQVDELCSFWKNHGKCAKKIEISSLEQPKQEVTIWYQDHKIRKQTHKYSWIKRLFRSIDTGNKQVK